MPKLENQILAQRVFDHLAFPDSADTYMNENARKESVSWTTHRNGPSAHAVASLPEFKAEAVHLFFGEFGPNLGCIWDRSSARSTHERPSASLPTTFATSVR